MADRRQTAQKRPTGCLKDDERLQNVFQGVLKTTNGRKSSSRASKKRRTAIIRPKDALVEGWHEEALPESAQRSSDGMNPASGAPGGGIAGVALVPGGDPPVRVISSRQVELYGWRWSELEPIVAAQFDRSEVYGAFDGGPWTAGESHDLIVVAR